MTEETIYYSESLGLNYKLKQGRLVTEDGVNYYPEEIEALAQLGDGKGKIDRKTHDVKKVFFGTIIRVAKTD